MLSRLLFGGIVVLLGLLIAVIHGLLPVLQACRARHTWSTTEGEILDIYLIEHRRDRTGLTPTYVPAVSYRYTVNGQVYTGHKFGFGTVQFLKKKVREKIATYHPGTKITVHYDAADPAKAVLETIATGMVGAFFAGGILIVFGIFFMFIGYMTGR